MLKIKLLWLTWALLIAGPTCACDQPTVETSEHFYQHVLPLLRAKCWQCHGPAKQEGKLRLDSLAGALLGGETGTAIVPGNPAESLLVQAVNRSGEGVAEMPPKDPLGHDQVEHLAKWVRDGAVWPAPVMVLFDEEAALVDSLREGDGPTALDHGDRSAGAVSLSVGRQRFAAKIDGWNFPIAADPKPGEYRYLRFAWKKRGSAGGVMFELANSGQWRTQQRSSAAWSAGDNTTGWEAISVATETPREWTVVTRDLWADRGEWDALNVTGFCLTSIDGGEVLIDAIVLAPTLASLDAFRSGDADRARFALPQPAAPIGDAWSDARNPVVKAFRGERLDLWSLQPVQRQAVPDVESVAANSPIDRFIVARLHAEKLRLSPAADRRTLIRRLSFDLLGLPPTPDEVEAFVRDESPDAYDQLVERLLASKHYGERAAQHWLDVVRYSDTNGFERDEYRPTMYRYRDYVVRSFNADKPYDQFVREQLAGDELVLEQPRDERAADALIATGYLRTGPRDTTAEIFEENARARDQLMADLANTTGEALLGLTMSCCQCHDHKYDPLLQADHFRLRAFFAALKFDDHTVVDTDEQRAEIEQQNSAIEAEAAPLRMRLSELLATGRGPIIAHRRAEFPQDIQQLLEQDEASLDDEAKKKLEPFKAKLDVNDQDALAALNEEQRKQHDDLAGQVAEMEKRKRAHATAWCAVDEGASAPETRIYYQGDIAQPREAVEPGFLSLLDPNPAKIIPPPSDSSTGRRTALADWIVARENPLTARVMVNRLWQQHFGRGIVGTPNDFGFPGERPTHPELLDWLAAEFMESGWSIKHMHRLMVKSAAYRQTSTINDAAAKSDRQNSLLWQQNPRRLDAESLRDALLIVSGRLLPIDSGPPAWPAIPEQVRLSNPATLDASDDRLQDWYTTADQGRTLVRSLFTVQKRSIQLPLLMAFDEPSGERTCGRRDVTIVAPQAAMLMNSPLAVECAEELARRVREEAGGEVDAQIDRAFRLALVRAPAKDELAAARDLVARHTEKYREAGSESPELDALTDLCRALVNTNEFVYID